MVTHNFPPKWFSCQPKSYNMSTISLLTTVLNMLKIGLKLKKLPSEVAYLGILSVFVPDFYLNTPVLH